MPLPQSDARSACRVPSHVQRWRRARNQVCNEHCAQGGRCGPANQLAIELDANSRCHHAGPAATLHCKSFNIDGTRAVKGWPFTAYDMPARSPATLGKARNRDPNAVPFRLTSPAANSVVCRTAALGGEFAPWLFGYAGYARQRRCFALYKGG